MSEGRYAYQGLDRVLHEKARLGILTALAGHPAGLYFTELKELCALTDGNLSRHLSVLADASLVASENAPPEDGEGRAQTLYRLSTAGRRRFLDYVAELERVVADAGDAGKARAKRGLRPRTS